MQDATRCLQCLTRLCSLTDPGLLRDVWPVVLRIARLVARFRSQAITPSGTFDFENDLARLLSELGRRIFQWTINHVEPKEPDLLPRFLFWDGGHYRLKRLSPTRNLNCLFGPIRLYRYLYEETEGQGLACLFPLELKLGLVQGIATAALADRIAQWSVDFTQRQLLDILRTDHRIHWGAGTLRKVQAAVAEEMGSLQLAAQMGQLLHWIREAAKQDGPQPVTLAVGRDGVMLPIRGSNKYREGAAATLSVINRLGKRVGTIYLGQMPQEGQTTMSSELTLLIEGVLSAWDGPSLRLMYITDAGFHPEDYFHQVLSKMPNPRDPGRTYQWTWIVDYYHTCQYVTRIAEAIFGPGQEAHAWASKMRDWLKTKPGGVFRVLRSAGALRSIRGLVGSESAYDTAYAYLRNRSSMMDYQHWRSRQAPIGSGVTEAACKIVFTQRFKRAGMKWNIEDGKPIVTLRTIALSGIWSEVRTSMLAIFDERQPRTHSGFCADSTKIAA